MPSDDEIGAIMDEFPISGFSPGPELHELSDEDLRKIEENDRGDFCGTHAEEARQVLVARELCGGQKGLEEFRREMQDPSFLEFAQKILYGEDAQ